MSRSPWLPTAALASMLLLAAGCGSSSDQAAPTPPLVPTTVAPPSPVDCVRGQSPTRIEIDVANRNVISAEQLSGTVALSLLSRGNPPGDFENPFIGLEPIKAQGKFIGFRYEVTNHATAGVQPALVVNDGLYLTDGRQYWEAADYGGGHSTGVSGAYSVTQGDEQPESEIAAGFAKKSWAVFDVPVMVEPVALALQTPRPGGVEQKCLALPPPA